MKGEPAAQETSLAPPPRANPDLLGHETVERSLRQLLDAGRMPHAILLSGPRGIGKATLAYRLARFVLMAGAGEGTPPGLFGDISASSGVGLFVAEDAALFRRVASGGHADLLSVERAYDVRRRRMRSEIVVEDTREIGAFLRLTSAEGGWRVVVVDGADEMNRNAANALLKVLEEPPRRALLLLVAHSPGRLLPTIRSRCRRCALSPLPDTIVRELLGRFRPDLPAAQTDPLIGLAEGSIGRALDLAASGGVELYRAVLDLIGAKERLDVAALHSFADRLARADADDAYRVVEDLVAQILARLALTAAAAGNNAGDAAVFSRLGARAPASRWAELRDEIGQNFARADALNLDRKQTILSTFFAIDAAAR